MLFLKSADYFWADSCALDQFPLVLAFSEIDRPLVLNTTNATTMAELHGPETDSWGGKKVKLVPATTQYQGKLVKCTRISPEIVG